MKINCIIVDDEPPAIKVIENYIYVLEQLELVGTCCNAFECINLLTTKKVDLIFLDINMPKLKGTQLINTLQSPPKFIFTTAHKDYAVEAFDLDAIDYLLKPISLERFIKAVNKYYQINTVEKDPYRNSNDFVYFRADRKMLKVFLEDIKYIESFKDYITIHRENDADLKVKQTISAVENMLSGYAFIRIHRSYIVSITKITALTKHDVEIGKVELPIGRSYFAALETLTKNQTNNTENLI